MNRTVWCVSASWAWGSSEWPDRRARSTPEGRRQGPAFSLEGTDGKTYFLDDFKGKKGVVIAWFPKASPPAAPPSASRFARIARRSSHLNVAYFTASVDPVDGETTAFAK